MSDWEQLIYLAAFKYAIANSTAFTRLLTEAIANNITQIDTDFLMIMHQRIKSALFNGQLKGKRETSSWEWLHDRINLELTARGN